jgi:RNA polymerase sigma-70 factor, ECF subfamily
MATPRRAPFPNRVRRLVDEIDVTTIRLIQLSRDRAAPPGLAAATVADAWCRVYEACKPLIRAIVRRRNRLPSAYDDQVQDIWVAVLSGLGQYDPDRGSLDAWVTAVAVNVLYERARQRRRPTVPFAPEEPELVGRERDPADQYDVCLERERLAAILRVFQSHVSATNYRIVHAHWMDGATFEQIATDLGLTETQVRDRNRRTMKVLRRLCAGGQRGA